MMLMRDSFSLFLLGLLARRLSHTLWSKVLPLLHISKRRADLRWFDSLEEKALMEEAWIKRVGLVKKRSPFRCSFGTHNNIFRILFRFNDSLAYALWKPQD
jgi:hypothetical protein